MSMQVIDTESMQKVSAKEVKPIPLYQLENLLISLLCLEVNQIVGPCTMTNQVMYLMLSGKGELIVTGEERQLLNSGSLIVIPAGVERMLLAKEQSRVLTIQSS